MARNLNLGNSVKPLRNVAALAQLVRRVEDRAHGLPGMATFYGPSGMGKTYACSFAAATQDCIHVSVQDTWTKKKLIQTVLRQLSIVPKGTIADMQEALNMGLAASGPTLLVDEADHAVKLKLIETIRGMHDGSDVPVILVGEELLPQKLKQWERVNGRMLSWVGAEPADLRDARLLSEVYAPNLEIDEALLKRVLSESRGSARIISTNLAFIQEQALLDDCKEMTNEDWGNRPFHRSEAPVPRELAP